MKHTQALQKGLLPARSIPGFTGPWHLNERMDHYQVPGVSVAVIDQGEVVLSEAFGRKAVGSTEAVAPTTLFQTASMSKAITAYGALRLVQEGVLPLDEDLRRTPLSWDLPRNGHSGNVTLRRLLSHAAGLNVPGFEGYQPSSPLPTLAQCLSGEHPANSPAVSVVYPPGEGFHYSGGGYLVVQALIESATGRRFEHVMSEYVFDPLGMRRSLYAPLPPSREAEAARGHSETGAAMAHGAPIHVESAAGGLWSTAADLASWVSDLIRAARGEQGACLNDSLAHEMMTPGHWSFGLGVRVLGAGTTARFNHGGATTGWHGQFIADVGRSQGIVILTNSANGYLLWPEIERGIAQSLGWPGWESEMLKPVASLPSLDQYLGVYALGEDVRVNILPHEMGLKLVHGGIELPAVPVADDRFELLDLVGHLHFQRAGDGEIEAFDLSFDMPDWAPYRRWSFARARGA
jgi:CubicO group peptidase (beta-lactamase class C family)